MRITNLILITFTAAVYAMGTAYSEDSDVSDEDLKVIPFKEVTKKGLLFRVPDDMPFVEKDGILKPIDFNEYFYSKISKLEGEIEQLEGRLERTKSALEKMEQNLTERQKNQTASSPLSS